MATWQRSVLRIACIALLVTSQIGWGAEPADVPLADVAKHVDKEATVQFVVQSSRLLDTGKFCFLNSEKDFQQKKNFTVVIGKEALTKFKDAKIDDPAAHYLKKTIRVTGKIVLFKERPQIEVTRPDQIVTAPESKK